MRPGRSAKTKEKKGNTYMRPNMNRKRTSRRFNEAPDLDVSKQAGKNIAGLTGNPALPNPPASPAELTTKKDTFDLWIVKAANKGKYETEQKDAPRFELLKV